MTEKADWEAEVNRRRAEGAQLEFEEAIFAEATHTDLPNEALKAFLDDQVASGVLKKIETWRCPISGCTQLLSAAMLENQQCPTCGTDYQSKGVVPVSITRYRIEGELSRDMRWMIVIHGMNSRAAWQEDFSWKIANKLKYSAPVLIYKYGLVVIDVLVGWEHKQIAKELGRKLERAIAYASANGIDEPPDVVAHSFGSLLFALVLSDPDYAHLTFGRVISAGSIIRPDHDWSALIASGRIEAIFNHTAGKDNWVRAAHYAIPGSGPGGYLGYMDRKSINVRSDEYKHSDCLTEAVLNQNLADDGLWESFLTKPLAHFRPAEYLDHPVGWKPACCLIRLLTHALGHTLFCVLYVPSRLRRLIDP